MRLYVDGKSQTGRIAYATGLYEPRATELIKSSLKPGDLFVDIGANIGYFSLLAARTVGDSGQVIAFEPVPAVREALLHNLSLNQVGNVIVRAEALGPTEGEVRFYCGPDGDTGLASLRALDQGREIVVNQVAFDQLDRPKRRVAFVKIDVEGAELHALSGMQKCLRRDQPHLIVEFTDAYLRGMNASAKALYEYLAALGYRIFHIPEEGELRPLDTADALSTCPTQFNAFCTTSSGH